MSSDGERPNSAGDGTAAASTARRDVVLSRDRDLDRPRLAGADAHDEIRPRVAAVGSDHASNGLLSS